tara:strand:- start:1265 stop:2017 length:753 start_codon:yes stop_codon:yes gene_type:complete
MIVAKTYENVRGEIIELIRRKKLAQPDFRVVDVGGAAGNWCDEFVDAYVDMRDFPTSKQLYVGDICREETWAKIPAKSFDFAICTHVLEDIRDPLIAIRGLEKISKSGFVATPTKWNEFSVFEDSLWLGNYHHRWIFDFDDSGNITIVPKFGAINRFMIQNKFLYSLGPVTILRRISSALGLKKSGRLLGPDVLRKNWKSPYPGHELSFIWKDSIPIDFHDWYANPRALLDHYREIFEREADPLFRCDEL